MFLKWIVTQLYLFILAHKKSSSEMALYLYETKVVTNEYRAYKSEENFYVCVWSDDV